MKNFIEIKDNDNKNVIININTITSINRNSKGKCILWSVAGQYLPISEESYEKLRAILFETNEEGESE